MSRITARGVRRFFQYAVLYALLLITAIGLADLLIRLFGADFEPWEDPDALLARALAFGLVGGPLAMALLWWTHRSHRRDPDEASAPLLTVYLTIASLTGVLAFAPAVQELISRLILEASFSAPAMAGVLVWGPFWLLHWLWARHVLDVRRNTLHLLLGSLYGLVLAAAGLTQLLGASLDTLLRPDVVGYRLGGLASGAGLFTAGAVVWSVYWLTRGIRLPRRTLWLIYVLPIGVGGGLILALVAASRLLWSVFVWLLGDRLGASTMQHFDTAGFELAAMLVGLLLWWYHRAILGVMERSEAQRVYEYLVTGIALCASAIGVGTVIVALIEAVTPGTDIGMTVLNTLWAAITLLLVGVPVWWVFWRRVQRATVRDPGAEIPSVSRRIYLVLLFGVAAVAAVIALILVAITFFNDLVDGVLGPATLRAMRYGFATLVAATAVSAYHGAVFRRDRADRVAEVRVAGPRSVTLVGAPGTRVAQELSRATGARVEVWSRLDEEAAPWDVDALVASLGGYAGEDVVILGDAGGHRIVSVDPSGQRSGRSAST